MSLLFEPSTIDIPSLSNSNNYGFVKNVFRKVQRMTIKDKSNRCLLQLLHGEKFLKGHRQNLVELYQDLEFRQLLDLIEQSQDEETVYPVSPYDNKNFKSNILNDILFQENAYFRFPAYKKIVDDTANSGSTKLSATISIFYALKYWEATADEQPKKETLHVEDEVSDADYRKKWSAEYRCEDGHYVRSKNEQLLDNWLYNHGYVHAYEKLVIDQATGREYLSDFYLPLQDLYIEIWGYENEEYIRRRNNKIAIYRKNNLRLLQMTDKEVRVLDDYMLRALKR